MKWNEIRVGIALCLILAAALFADNCIRLTVIMVAISAVLLLPEIIGTD